MILNKILLFLFVLLLPTQLGKHFFLPFSFLSGVRSDYLAPTIYLTDIIVFFLLVINLKSVIKFFRNKYLLLILFLLLINILFSLSPLISLYRFIKIVEWLIVFGIFVGAYRNTPVRIHQALLFSGLFELILSVWQLTIKHSVQGIFYWFGERYFTLSMPDLAKASLQGIEFIRPYGTFSHPNSMGGFYLLIYFFTLTYSTFNKRAGITPPLQKYFLLFISTLLIFLSFSKIAIITYLILNLVYYLITSLQGLALQIKNICKPCIIARILVLIVLSLVFLSAQGDVLSLDKRFLLIKNSLQIFIQHPFFGTGIGAYLVAQNKIPMTYGYYFQQPVHNIFLLFLTETGIIITGIIVWLLTSWFRHKKSRVTVLLCYCVTVVAITGLFDHYWLTLQQNLLLIPLIFGVLYNTYKE